ncbi:hypothetical protein TeGR_g12829, partial [Tetraparma gracilis]
MPPRTATSHCHLALLLTIPQNLEATILLAYQETQQCQLPCPSSPSTPAGSASTQLDALRASADGFLLCLQVLATSRHQLCQFFSLSTIAAYLSQSRVPDPSHRAAVRDTTVAFARYLYCQDKPPLAASPSNPNSPLPPSPHAPP